MNYRDSARTHFDNAERELGTGDDQRLKYAALELRMAIESLTYDRALAYKDEFPPNEYETWQPRKVMAVLLEIDSTADKDCSLAVGTEQEYGVPAPVMHSLGSETIFNMSLLRKHYDALGSFLYVPSLKQARDGKVVDLVALRSRCDAIGAYITQVLSSPVFNITIGNFSAIKCLECDSVIRKRLSPTLQEIVAECFGCQATYTLTDQGDGKVHWRPHQQEIECANKDCAQKIFAWRHEFKVGRFWKCDACNGQNEFVMGIRHVPSSSEKPPPSPESP